MDAEKQKLTPEQLKDVTGGESAWWTGDTSTYLYICHLLACLRFGRDA